MNIENIVAAGQAMLKEAMPPRKMASPLKPASTKAQFTGLGKPGSMPRPGMGGSPQRKMFGQGFKDINTTAKFTGVGATPGNMPRPAMPGAPQRQTSAPRMAASTQAGYDYSQGIPRKPGAPAQMPSTKAQYTALGAQPGNMPRPGMGGSPQRQTSAPRTAAPTQAGYDYSQGIPRRPAAPPQLASTRARPANYNSGMPPAPNPEGHGMPPAPQANLQDSTHMAMKGGMPPAPAPSGHGMPPAPQANPQDSTYMAQRGGMPPAPKADAGVTGTGKLQNWGMPGAPQANPQDVEPTQLAGPRATQAPAGQQFGAEGMLPNNMMQDVSQRGVMGSGTLAGTIDAGKALQSNPGTDPGSAFPGTSRGPAPPGPSPEYDIFGAPVARGGGPTGHNLFGEPVARGGPGARDPFGAPVARGGPGARDPFGAPVARGGPGARDPFGAPTAPIGVANTTPQKGVQQADGSWSRDPAAAKSAPIATPPTPMATPTPAADPAAPAEPTRHSMRGMPADGKGMTMQEQLAKATTEAPDPYAGSRFHEQLKYWDSINKGQKGDMSSRDTEINDGMKRRAGSMLNYYKRLEGQGDQIANSARADLGQGNEISGAKQSYLARRGMFDSGQDRNAFNAQRGEKAQSLINDDLDQQLAAAKRLRTPEVA